MNSNFYRWRWVALCLVLLVLNSSAAVLYVSVNSTNPSPPYTNWATAATNIQAAIDSSTNGDSILVTNGVYLGGIVTTNAVVIQSVNGSGVTWINGNHTASCATLTDGTSLIGFTLTNGYAFNGGGVDCGSTNVFISSCVLTGNLAWGNYGGGALYGTFCNCTIISNTCRDIDGAGMGGGTAFSVVNNCTFTNNLSGNGGAAIFCTLNNCILSGNQATAGGGAAGSTLNNCLIVHNSAIYDYTIASEPSGGGLASCTATGCTIVGNDSAYYPRFTTPAGGGAYDGTLNNCIIYGNTFNSVATDNYHPGQLNNCCTTPLPANGANNFTNAPLFINQSGGNYRLQSTCSCINSGNNAYNSTTTDLDGNPRTVGGTVDIGAYEYQTPASIISYAWLQRYGLPTSGSADYLDSDGDGMNNWQEWIAGTNPTNALSVLKMASATPTNNPQGIVVTWQSVSGINYFLQSAGNLAMPPVFTTIQSNIVGQAGTTSYTDTTATNSGPYFYRVGVQ